MIFHLEQTPREFFPVKFDPGPAWAGWNKPIYFVNREEGSGTRDAFENLVMKKGEISDEALVQDSNGSVREIIANNPQAIGYISFGLSTIK